MGSNRLNHVPYGVKPSSPWQITLMGQNLLVHGPIISPAHGSSKIIGEITAQKNGETGYLFLVHGRSKNHRCLMGS
jgi:hypothetical protein